MHLAAILCQGTQHDIQRNETDNLRTQTTTLATHSLNLSRTTLKTLTSHKSLTTGLFREQTIN